MDSLRGLWRGKCKSNGEWVEGGYFKTQIAHEVAHCIVPLHLFVNTLLDDEVYQIIPETLGECTGLPDKNGKPIFEGDIVKYINSIGIIRFGQYHSPFSPPSECHLGFYVDWEGRDSKNLRKDLGYWVSFKPVMIIGNIHDNPELLSATGEDIGNAANETILPAT